MKKNISDYKALLVSLASKGDCTAFYSLIVPYLESVYKKSINEGVDHAEACSKLCAKGVELYKKFIGTETVDFNQWLATNDDAEETETDFLPSNNVQVGSFLSELHLELQRARSLQHTKSNKNIFTFFKSTAGKIVLSSLSVLILLSIVIFFLFHYSIKIQISTSEKKGFYFTFSSVQDSSGLDSTNNIVAVKDTTTPDTIPKTQVNTDTITKKQRPLTQTRKAVPTNVDHQPKSSISTTTPITAHKENAVSSDKTTESSLFSSTNIANENSGNPITPPKPTSSVIDSIFENQN